MLVKPDSKDHPTLVNRFFGQSGKHATRTALHADRLIGVDSRIGAKRRTRLALMKFGTNPLAQAATDTRLLVYIGIQKALLVLTHGDTMLGATLCTGCTAAT